MIGSVIVGSLVGVAVFLLWSASRSFMAGETVWMNVTFAGAASVLFGIATVIVLEVYL